MSKGGANFGDPKGIKDLAPVDAPAFRLGPRLCLRPATGARGDYCNALK